METTNSQITFLEKFLWEHLKADQEPLEEFAQRINGAYFSHHDIDFDPAALTSWDDIPIPGSPGEIDERQKLSFFVCTANVIFLGQEIPEARKRRKDIVRRVTAIVQDHPEANRYKNDILTACLSLLVVEKDLKDYAHFRRTRQIPVHAESVQKYCKGVEQATQILLSAISQAADERYVEVRIRGSLSDKMRGLGFTPETLIQLANHVKQVRAKELSFLEGKKDSLAYANRQSDYTQMSRDFLKYVVEVLKSLGFPPGKAKRETAVLLDLFGIRCLKDVKEDNESLTREDAIKGCGTRSRNAENRGLRRWGKLDPVVYLSEVNSGVSTATGP